MNPLLFKKMESLSSRPNLSDFDAPRTKRFCASVVIAIGILGLFATAFAAFVLPKIQLPELIVHVIATPPAPQEEPIVVPPQQLARILPPPTPVQSQPIPQPLPTPPIPPIEPPTPTEMPDLVAQTDEALNTWNRIQEEEELRLQEVAAEQERQRKAAEAAALLAQQKEAEEKVKRERLEEARRIAAREAEIKRAQEAEERAIVQAEANRKAAIANAEANAEANRRAEIARAEANRQAEANRVEANRRAALAQAEAQRRANEALAKRVASTPALTSRTAPKYPTSARRSGAQGTTKISATITSSGRVSKPKVITSSGHRSLDSSAISAVKKWRFAPAKNGLGQPIAYQMTIPVSFRLN